MKSTIEIAVARLENQAATAPYSRSSIPRPGLKPGWNLESPPEKLRCEAPGFHNELTAASLGRLARLQTLALGSRKALVTRDNSAPDFSATEKKILLSCNPPRFKILKSGPRAGQTVEVKMMILIVTHTVTDSDGLAYSFSNRSSKARVTPRILPLTEKEIIRLTPSEVRATFLRRWPATGAALADAFLTF